MKRTLYAAAAIIAISSAAFMPTPAMAQIGLNIVIGNAPPPPRFESVPQARRGYVWAPGFWNWEGKRHVWIAGRWEAERNGQRYQHAEWVRENDNWRLNRGGWVGVQAQPVDVDYVRVAPPPPRFERMPHPRHGHVWAAGHWEWRGQRHDWVPGVWIAERPGYLYSPAGWVQRDGRWFMQEGRWTPRGGRGDRDRDGIPDRYEHERYNGGGRDGGHGAGHDGGRDRDHDGIRDRRDHDRDGDGVPNRNDNHPDNPRRD